MRSSISAQSGYGGYGYNQDSHQGSTALNGKNGKSDGKSKGKNGKNGKNGKGGQFSWPLQCVRWRHCVNCKREVVTETLPNGLDKATSRQRAAELQSRGNSRDRTSHFLYNDAFGVSRRLYQASMQCRLLRAAMSRRHRSRLLDALKGFLVPLLVVSGCAGPDVVQVKAPAEMNAPSYEERNPYRLKNNIRAWHTDGSTSSVPEPYGTYPEADLEKNPLKFNGFHGRGPTSACASGWLQAGWVPGPDAHPGAKEESFKSFLQCKLWILENSLSAEGTGMAHLR